MPVSLVVAVMLQLMPCVVRFCPLDELAVNEVMVMRALCGDGALAELPVHGKKSVPFPAHCVANVVTFIHALVFGSDKR